jgi:uncharacterized membrane protein
MDALVIVVVLGLGVGALLAWSGRAARRERERLLQQAVAALQQGQRAMEARIEALEHRARPAAPEASEAPGGPEARVPAAVAAPAPAPAALTPPEPEAPLPTSAAPAPAAPDAIPAAPPASWPAPPTVAPPAPRPAPPRPRAPAAPSAFAVLAARLRSFDWEGKIGVVAFSSIAAVAVIAAAGYFVVYSASHGWLRPPIRLAIALAVGTGLVVASVTRFADRYPRTVQPLAAAGVAVLFFAVFAGHTLWHLLPGLATFGLLAFITAVAVLLAVLRSAMVVAVLGLLGGFAAPFVVRSGENNYLGLFGYLLLLNVALAWVAHRKRWPILSALSLLLTMVYQGGWAARFLRETPLPSALGIFIVFPVVGFAGITLGARRPRTSSAAPSALARWTAVAGAVPPALLALYVAGSADYAAHWPLVLAFAAVVGAGLAVVAAWQGPEWLHLAGGGTVLATLGAFLLRSFDGSQWPGLAGLLAVLVALYLGAPLLLARLGRDFRAEGRLGALVAPLVLAAFAVAAHPASGAAPLRLLAPLLALTAACAAYAVLRGDGLVHLAAGATALLGEAAWSAFHLDASTLLPALLAYAAFAALFLGAPLLAERRGKPLQDGHPGPLLLAALCVLVFVADGAFEAALGTLVGLTGLAALIVAALFLLAARGRSLVLALAGVVLAFLLLALWSVTALAQAVLPGLLAAGALAGVALAGALLVAGRRPGGEADPARRAGPYLALGGHLFVAVVAASRGLAIPAAPWLAVLAVLDLGFVVAALLARRGALAVSAAAASALVLLAHQVGLGLEPPAPAVAGAAALGLAALFLLGWLVARRTGAAPASDLDPFGLAALVAVHGGQIALWLGSLGTTLLPAPFLVGAHLALGAAALAVAWLSSAEAVALVAAGLGAVGGALLAPPLGDRAPEALCLAVPAWLLAVGYPLVRGGRSRAERLPFVGAVVASAAFLLVGRSALVALGAGAYLGALPVVEALALVPHLLLLLRLEPAGARDLGRLATVAAAVLGLVTVAIPFQLEKQWWTIGWALLAAALAWLFGRVPHRGLLAWAAALLTTAFVRMVPFLNPWIFRYHARGQSPILNWFLYAYLLVAGAHLAVAWLLSGADDRLFPRWPRLSALAAAGGGILLFFLVNVEIADLWSQGERITFRFSAGLAPDLSYTIAWAVFAVALLVAGIALRSRAARLSAIALLGVTVLKGGLHDTAHLEGLYRVASLLGLAVALSVVALLLQRFVLHGRDVAASAAPLPPEVP